VKTLSSAPFCRVSLFAAGVISFAAASPLNSFWKELQRPGFFFSSAVSGRERDLDNGAGKPSCSSRQ
jgi:hypothetical protein